MDTEADLATQLISGMRELIELAAAADTKPDVRARALDLIGEDADCLARLTKWWATLRKGVAQQASGKVCERLAVMGRLQPFGGADLNGIDLG